MKMRRIWKKGLSLVTAFALAMTLFINLGVLEPKAAGAVGVQINGNTMSVSSDNTVAYLLNDGTAGNAESYNAKLEYGDDVSTLTLSGLDITLSNIGIYVPSGDLNIVLVGTNKIVDANSDVSYMLMNMTTSNVTISGSGSLTYEDEACYNSKTINVASLNITDSAQLYIDLGTTYNFTYVMYATGDVKIGGQSNVNISVDGVKTDCYGITAYKSTSALEVTDSASIDIDILDDGSHEVNSAVYGLYSSGTAKLSTSGDVTIDATQYSAYGIYARTSLDIDGTDPVIKLGDAENNSYGVQVNGPMTMSNGAKLTVTSSIVSQTDCGKVGTEKGVELNGILTMSGGSSITATLGSADYLYGVSASSGSSMSEGSAITVTTGAATYTLYGVNINGIFNMSSSSIKVKTGSGSNVRGVYSTGSNILTGSSSIDVDVTGVTIAGGYKICGVQQELQIH